jgi:hypothetical protein
MAIDLETGEVGNAWELYAKACQRQQKRWAAHIAAGLERVSIWKRDHFGRKVSPTRFYKLMHGTSE